MTWIGVTAGSRTMTGFSCRQVESGYGESQMARSIFGSPGRAAGFRLADNFRCICEIPTVRVVANRTFVAEHVAESGARLSVDKQLMQSGLAFESKIEVKLP